jgi:hypothetical protein
MFMEPAIKDFFNALSPKKKKLAFKVREIVLKSDLSLKEYIKWGNLTFVHKGNIAFIYSYDTVDYITLGFFKGTELSDPQRRLEGTGKSMRHMKIGNENDIDEKQITMWVNEAVKLNQKLVKP